MRFAFSMFVVVAAMIGYGSFLQGMEMGRRIPADADTEEVWDYRDDSWFLFGMIEHHKAAIEMARMVQRNGSNETVAEWAQAIIRDQTAEIERMEAVVNRLGLRDHSGAAESMRDHMMEMMDEAFSPDPDINFAAMMIPHHASAIDMAVPALVESDDEEIRTIARDIITAQAAEIFDFRRWLDMKGYTP